jgi:hypothetical protein
MNGRTFMHTVGAALVVAAIAVVVVGSASCASAPAKGPQRPPPPPDAPGAMASETDAMEVNILAETRKTAAAELDCPSEELLVSCTARDAHGGCVAISAKGCGKSLDYSFGNE